MMLITTVMLRLQVTVNASIKNDTDTIAGATPDYALLEKNF